MVETPEPMRPDREIARPVADDRVPWKCAAQMLHRVAHLECTRRIDRGRISPGKELGVRITGAIGPDNLARRLHHLKRGREANGRCIYRKLRVIDFAELARIRMDMHQLLSRRRDFKERVALRRHLGQASTYEQDQIRLLDAGDELWIGSDAEIAGVAGVL